MTTFDHTRAALIEYDQLEPQRQQAWDAAVSNEDIEAAAVADLVALRKVRAAYFLDTQKFNSLDSCAHAPIDFMRRMANK